MVRGREEERGGRESGSASRPLTFALSVRCAKEPVRAVPELDVPVVRVQDVAMRISARVYVVNRDPLPDYKRQGQD